MIKYILILRNKYYQWISNLWIRNGLSDNVLISYYDNHKENAEIIILLHGFSSNKESCLPIASNLSSKYRIIIPDLIGHGQTKHLNDNILEYELDIQLEYLKSFIINNITPDKKIHIMGYSMGGLLAGCFSAKYPNMVKSVNLLSTAGISMPKRSLIFNHYIQTGENLLSTKTPYEAKRLLHLLQYYYKFLPNFIFKYYSKTYNNNAKIYDKIFDDLVVKNYPILENNLKYIKSDVLVIWGKNDNVVDISCIDQIKKHLNVDYTINIIPNTGHIIHTTHAKYCANLIDIHIKNNS
jgi:pimeloyl-ACP methyl ester carboxylesterase